MKQKSDRPQTDGTNASTGPRTDSGKATSSRNAETHGLTSARFILPEEDRDAFTQLLENLLEEHSPASETERLLVLQIAQSFWQEQRSCPPAARLLTSEPDRRMRKRYAVRADLIDFNGIRMYG